MRIILHAASFSVLALVAAGGARAADLGGPAPYTPAPTYDWSGGYFGVQAGVDWNSAITPTPGPFFAQETGLIGGIYGGYNWQSDPNWVWGLDASINWDGATGTATPPAPGTPNSAGPTWKGFLRGRVGYAWDSMLLYATGGAVVAGYTANVTGFTSGTATPWGWTVGAGVEMAISEGWVGRIDYAYQNFGTFVLGGPGPVGGTAVTLSGNTLMVGIAKRY